MKPRYSTTRMQLRLSFVFGWLCIFVLILAAIAGRSAAVELAPIVIPSMAALIAALLGIHRFAGSLDFRAMYERDDKVSDPPPYAARDQPGDIP